MPVLVWVIAAAFVAVELLTSGRYGFMQDELYFIEAGRHLAFGYVDQPPLMPLLDKTTGFLGLNPTAIRIIPALAGGALVLTAARFAALFGGRRFAQVLAALGTACAPVTIGADHVGNTTPLELLAWSVALLCVTTALLRDQPRWWIGAGLAAGIGLQDNNLVVLFIIALAIGLAATMYRPVLATRWPWIAVGLAAVIWLPNLIWQATHGWPQFAMASALHQENNSVKDYIGGIPAVLLYAGVLFFGVYIAGLVRLWRARELRFIAVIASLVIFYVVAWIPGRPYYTDGLLPAILAAGAVAAEVWAARARWPAFRRTILISAALVGMLILLPETLPIVPVTDLHSLPASAQQSSDIGDTVGFPQLARVIVTQDAALTRAGERPTSIYAGYYGEAGAIDVLAPSGSKLPPVLSGQNAYWMWGPGHASDRTVLVVDALGPLRRYFASCRLLTTYHAPDHVKNDWTPIPIGVCTGPTTGWKSIWPHLKYYG
jgi:4-amino-4-deoxy-L-arabinose transferase-like glycosyltransferase